MIRFERHSIRFAEAWFDEPLTAPQPDVLLLRHSRLRPIKGSFSTKYSLLSDLTLSEEELWARLTSECRRTIRRAQEAGLDLKAAHVPDDAEIIAFVDYINRFAQGKGIEGTSVGYLRAIAAENRLRISSIAHGSEVLAQHSYITTGSNVRVLFGGSVFRSAGSKREQQLLSFAHRQLTWSGITTFKAAGFVSFDWGGMFADETVPGAKGVNDFKRQFGGEPVEYFETIRGTTTRGKLYLRIHPAFDKMRARMRAIATRPFHPKAHADRTPTAAPAAAP